MTIFISTLFLSVLSRAVLSTIVFGLVWLLLRLSSVHSIRLRSWAWLAVLLPLFMPIPALRTIGIPESGTESSTVSPYQPVASSDSELLLNTSVIDQTSDSGPAYAASITSGTGGGPGGGPGKSDVSPDLRLSLQNAEGAKRRASLTQLYGALFQSCRSIIHAAERFLGSSAIVWAGGCLLSLLLAAHRYASAVRLIREGTLSVRPLADEFPGLVQESHADSTELRIVRDIGPLLCRMGGRNVIVVPEDSWCRLSGAQQAAVLRHELAHLQNRDLWRAGFYRLLTAVYWFLPPVYFAVRRLTEISESICDRAATGGSTFDRLTYARALLTLSGSAHAFPVSAAAAARHGLAGRIRILLSDSPGKDSVMKKSVCTMALAGLTVLAFARVTVVAHSPPPDETSLRSTSSSDDSVQDTPSNTVASGVVMPDAVSIPVDNSISVDGGGPEYSIPDAALIRLRLNAESGYVTVRDSDGDDPWAVQQDPEQLAVPLGQFVQFGLQPAEDTGERSSLRLRVLIPEQEPEAVSYLIQNVVPINVTADDIIIAGDGGNVTRVLYLPSTASFHAIERIEILQAVNGQSESELLAAAAALGRVLALTRLTAEPDGSAEPAGTALNLFVPESPVATDRAEELRRQGTPQEAVVDLTFVIRNSAEHLAYAEKLQSIASRIERVQRELETELRELTRQADEAPIDERSALRLKAESHRAATTRRMSAMRRDLLQQESDAYWAVYRKVQKVVAAWAEESGIRMVRRIEVTRDARQKSEDGDVAARMSVMQSQVLYTSDEVFDATELVLERLNEQYRSESSEPRRE